MVQKWLISLALTGIVDAVSYMVVAPSIVFYVYSVGGTKEQYGLILSAFSFASFCTKPFLGSAADSYGFRIPYFVSLGLSTIGGVLYLFASEFETDVAIPVMLVGRLLGGVGAASSALGFAYLAKVVPHEEQTKTNSLLSMVRILGMAAGPGVNVFLNDIDTTLFGLKLDNLNSVGLVLICSNLIALLVMFLLLEEPDTDHTIKHTQSSKSQQHRFKSSSSVSSNGGILGVLGAFLYSELFVPTLSIFMLNASFQLVETGFAPAANHGVGWGPVGTSTVLGSISFIILFGMLGVFTLSARGVKDDVLLIVGLLTSIVGYGSMFFLWTWEAPVWHFVLPVVLGTASFPFLGAPSRSLYTQACDAIEELDGKQGTMQALLSMAASVAGFATPGFVAAYVMKEPEDVEASPPFHRELSPWALLAPLGSALVLAGVIWNRVKPSPYEDDDDDEAGEADETTGLVAASGETKGSSTSKNKKKRTPQTTKFPANVHIHRKSAAMVMGIPQDSHHREHYGSDDEDDDNDEEAMAFANAL